MQYNNVTWCWCAELYRRHRGMAGRQASTLPILREMNEGGKNSYVASRCAHESENVHFDDGNVASGRWQSNTCAHKLGSVLTNRTKGMQTRLRACSLRAVRLCCVQWKWKMCSFFFFCFFEIWKRTSCECICFCLLSASSSSSAVLCLFLGRCRSPFAFFSKNARICWLQMNVRTSRPEPWNWLSDVRCRPLLDAILSV